MKVVYNGGLAYLHLTQGKTYELIDKVYERFWDIIQERGLKLDDLIN